MKLSNWHIYIVLISVFNTWHINAQTPSVIGNVRDAKTEKPLIGAHVLVKSIADTFAYAAITSPDGNFRIDSIKENSYSLTISYLGYELFEKHIGRINKKTFVGFIHLEESTTKIDEVVVQAQIEVLKIIGDTMQYNADAFKTLPGSNAKDIVKKLPGIEIRREGIVHEGKIIRNILVDGKPFFEKNPEAALNTIPSEMIQYIQIYNRNSRESDYLGYKDENAVKAINLITKADKRTGIFGEAGAGYGTKNRYNGFGNANLFRDKSRIAIIGNANNVNNTSFENQLNAGNFNLSGSGAPGIIQSENIGFQYLVETKNFEINSGYFLNVKQVNKLDSTVKQFLPLEENSMQSFNFRKNEQISSKHTANMEVEYVGNINNSLRFEIETSFGDANNNQNVYDETFDNGNFSISNKLNIRKSDNYNIRGNTTWMHNFSKSGRRLVFHLRTSYNNRNELEDRVNENNFGIDSLSYQVTDFNNSSNRLNSSLKVSFAEKLSSKSRLILSYEAANGDFKNNAFLYNHDLESEEKYLDSLRSEISREQYIKNNLSSGYAYNSKKVNLTGNLLYSYVYQHNTEKMESPLDEKRIYSYFQPNVSFTWRLPNKNRLNSFYRTQVRPPSISSLTSTIDDSNPMSQRSGNPNLKKMSRHMMRINYSIGKKRGTTTNVGFYININQNAISNYTFLAESDTIFRGANLPLGATLSYPINTKGSSNMSGYASQSLPVDKIKSRLDLKLSLMNLNRNSYINNQYTNIENYTLGFRMNMNTFINDKLDASLTYDTKYSRSVRSGQNTSKTSYINHNLTNAIRWQIGKRLFLDSHLNMYFTNNPNSANNNSQNIWNTGLTVKLLQSRLLECSILAYNILNNNSSYHVFIDEFAMEERYVQNIESFVMFILSYKFRYFPGNTAQKSDNQRMRPPRNFE